MCKMTRPLVSQICLQGWVQLSQPIQTGKMTRPIGPDFRSFLASPLRRLRGAQRQLSAYVSLYKAHFILYKLSEF